MMQKSTISAIGTRWNSGAPKCSGGTTWNQEACAIPSVCTSPSGMAAIVPSIRAMRSANTLVIPRPKRSRSTTAISVPNPSSRLRGEPKSGEPWPPARSAIATGASETPMSVTKLPTTTLGNSISTFSSTKVSRKTMTPEAMIAPNRAGSP